MNQTRRSMIDALRAPPPEVLAIIQEGTPKPKATESATPATVVPSMPSKSATADPSESEAKAAQPRRSLPPARKEGEGTVGQVQLGFRVPPDIPMALVKASADRKTNRLRPYTQQDIVAEALTDWLQKHGYLKK